LNVPEKAIPLGSLEAGRHVRVVYMDGAGSGDEGLEPICVYAGVIVQPDEDWTDLEQTLKTIRDDEYQPRDSESFEFHACNLFEESKGNHPDRAYRTLMALLDVPRALELPIVCGAIDRRFTTEFMKGIKPFAANPKKELNKTTRDFRWNDAIPAFILCAQATELWFREFAANERCLLIADESDQPTDRPTIDKDTKIELRRIRNHPPYKHSLDHIINTVYFGDSRFSLAIQLADACAFFIKRHLMGRTDSDLYFGKIKEQIKCSKFVPETMRL
jgi:hypothetical protein